MRHTFEPARLRRRTVWHTKDGRRVRIREMTTEHIRNCIKVIERRCEQEHQQALGSIMGALSVVSGEVAQMTLENEMDFLMEEGWHDKRAEEYIASFERELARRGEHV